jgi:hypothetical protein
MKLRSVLLLTALLMLVALPAAQASVFFSAPYDPGSTNAFGADTSAPQYVYADYYWDGSFSITDFHWWGTTYADDHSYIDGFTVEIWSHDASWAGPDQALYSEYFAGDAGATFVETNVSYGLDVFKYGVDFSAPFTPLATGYYWFSVYAHSSSDCWYWAQSDADQFNSNRLRWRCSALVWSAWRYGDSVASKALSTYS